MAELALVTDPVFYAVAVPAVLLVGLSKSGLGGGFGALGVPLMALALPVPQAAAILLPLLAVMDALGLRALWRECDRDLLRLLLPAGLAGVGVGWALFGSLPPHTVAGLVGVITLAFLAIRTLWPPRADAATPRRGVGALLATVAGFTSFVAHAGAPPLGFYLLPLKLSPVRFAATSAVFFAAVNLAKWLPYAMLGLINLSQLGTALLLMPLAPLGVWLGVRLARSLQPALFYRLYSLGMGLTGVKLVWDGWF